MPITVIGAWCFKRVVRLIKRLNQTEADEMELATDFLTEDVLWPKRKLPRRRLLLKRR